MTFDDAKALILSDCSTPEVDDAAKNEEESSSLSTGAIVGIVVCLLILLPIVCMLLGIGYRQRKKKLGNGQAAGTDLERGTPTESNEAVPVPTDVAKYSPEQQEDQDTQQKPDPPTSGDTSVVASIENDSTQEGPMAETGLELSEGDEQRSNAGSSKGSNCNVHVDGSSVNTAEEDLAVSAEPEMNNDEQMWQSAMTRFEQESADITKSSPDEDSTKVEDSPQCEE